MVDTSFRFLSQQSAAKRRNRKGLSLAVPATRPHQHSIPAPSSAALIHNDSSTPTDNGPDKPYKQGPIRILPYLYLGDENNANDMAGLKYLHIGYILNVAKEVNHPSEHDFSMSDISEDDGGASSPCLSISSSASSASSINTLSSSFSFHSESVTMDAFHASPPDDLGAHSPFSPTRGVKPTPRGIRMLRFRPSNVSFTSAMRATAHRQSSMKRPSSSDMKGRRKRHVGQNDVAQNEDGTPFQQIKYKKFAWTHNHENLATELAPALQVIDRARAAKRAILVHCQCGVARSASLVIAYVMHAFKMSLDQAYDFVKAKSTSISPNMYLMFQLRDFETHQGLGLDHRSTTPPLRKCTSMQFTDVHHAFNALVKLDYPSPPATESIMLSRRSLDDSFYHSHSFRSESPFNNNLPMYL
ncbi:hypothetical protein K450DRAFT_255544 [Umbelopsis ramanniana AG]|uniref:protein-tyrosine-phosphatase n=1 Tax=Umbelopsis ramanniana AG TaxID=1314678 RepID=A0AAD5E4X6_UMBRA|nr:uncharacterized protein K450DRAFT_255544 [Umbelopsis ramanniana AG]KAI8576769.1 hypothetical protein K450DRAFT_255544 [Umbelopsis ramanniana AG]